MLAGVGLDIAAVVLAVCVGAAIVILAIGWAISKTPPRDSDG